MILLGSLLFLPLFESGQNLRNLSQSVDLFAKGITIFTFVILFLFFTLLIRVFLNKQRNKKLQKICKLLDEMFLFLLLFKNDAKLEEKEKLVVVETIKELSSKIKSLLGKRFYKNLIGPDLCKLVAEIIKHIEANDLAIEDQIRAVVKCKEIFEFYVD